MPQMQRSIVVVDHADDKVKLHVGQPLHGLKTLLDTDITPLRGKSLKKHEDQVDAVVCAYIALYAWHWGPARTEVFGTLEGGSILSPTLPERWAAP